MPAPLPIAAARTTRTPLPALFLLAAGLAAPAAVAAPAQDAAFAAAPAVASVPVLAVQEDAAVPPVDDDRGADLDPATGTPLEAGKGGGKDASKDAKTTGKDEKADAKADANT